MLPALSKANESNKWYPDGLAINRPFSQGTGPVVSAIFPGASILNAHRRPVGVSAT